MALSSRIMINTLLLSNYEILMEKNWEKTHKTYSYILF